MKTNLLFCLALAGLTSAATYAQDEAPKDDAAELAKKLSNPVANLISAPLQNNTDYGIGPNNGTRNTTNIQPVIPISISTKVNMIARVVLPVITQYNITAPGAKESGLSDATLTAFFSPKESGKFTWALGPAFLVPTGTDDYLTTKKFGIGPSALVLQQKGGWTYGALINQIWSVAGSDDRPDVNQMFVQPFLVHNWKTGAGLGLNAEWTQNWETSDATVWINPIVTGVTSLGKQKVSLGVGPRFNVAAPDGSKADMGWRAVLTFVFPE
jgi:hypothetical protein